MKPIFIRHCVPAQSGMGNGKRQELAFWMLRTWRVVCTSCTRFFASALWPASALSSLASSSMAAQRKT